MDDDLAASIGAAARERRRALGLTQADVAERLGLSVEFYARIERGHALPSVPTLVALIRLLGVSFDALVRDGRRSTPVGAHEPVDFYELGSPEQRRLYRRMRDAPPHLLRLLAETIASFDHAVAAIESVARKPRSARRGA